MTQKNKKLTKKQRLGTIKQLKKEHFEDGATDAPLWGSLNFKPKNQNKSDYRIKQLKSQIKSEKAKLTRLKKKLKSLE